ncbi:hypothetical protein L2E82_47372 [Cichorium intybus]|uniref:Uncharacterized protein n=1 Tax=Cichorium intybus TaxID=13427 RepID=A0ACB8YW10_CICIN|nr:hypothetical protein L2E82_47372 [Cichorium intybus]
MPSLHEFPISEIRIAEIPIPIGSDFRRSTSTIPIAGNRFRPSVTGVSLLECFCASILSSTVPKKEYRIGGRRKSEDEKKRRREVRNQKSRCTLAVL